MQYRAYAENKRVMAPKRLTDKEYAAAIARFPRVCADIIPINRRNRTIYLAKRKLGHPNGWWWIGGALSAGEKPERAAQRNLKRETSLKLPVKRFDSLPKLNFYIWNLGNHSSKNLSCNDIVFCYLIEPSEKEIARMSRNLDQAEYEQSAALIEFSRAAIKNQAGFNELARKIILDIYDEVFPK
ncbi:MAG: NUDIX hydrolase [bacterium]|nr:NUDIX hydrolase [bacterium]